MCYNLLTEACALCVPQVLTATGRRARTEGLDLPACDVALAPNGDVPVRPDLRVADSGGAAVEGLFATGDVIGAPQLAYTSPRNSLHIEPLSDCRRALIPPLPLSRPHPYPALTPIPYPYPALTPIPYPACRCQEEHSVPLGDGARPC